jgi:hypothetical protein
MKDEEIHKSINQILSKGTVHKAPADMSQRVLKAWKAQEATLAPAPPIIPAWVWWSVVSGVVALTVWVINDRNTTGTQIPNGYLSWLKFDIEPLLPEPNPVLLMSLMAVAVMILINVVLVKKKELG